MVSHCVNPKCHTALYSLSEGRLFQFEIVSISVSASDESSAPFDEKPECQTSQFWLCGRCAATMRLVMGPNSGLKLVPLAEMKGTADSGMIREAMPHLSRC